jgi:hypothetical protein
MALGESTVARARRLSTSRSLIVACITCACVAAGSTAPARAAGTPTETQPLQELWSRYPLVPKKQPAAASASTRSDQKGTGDGVLLTVLLGFGAVAVAATLVMGKRKIAVQREEGVAMTVFKRDRRDTSEGAPHLNVADRIRAAANTQITEVIPEVVGDSGADAERAKQQGPSPQDDLTAVNIGERISSVLQSAQEAARTIEEEARREAASLIGRAQHEADELRQSAFDEAAGKNADAESTLQAAQKQSEQTRGDADAYAQRRREEAEQRAGQRLADARAEAASIARVARERHDELLSHVALTEDRLKVLSTALKNVAHELDKLIEEGSDDSGSQRDDPKGLDEALRSRTGATT